MNLRLLRPLFCSLAPVFLFQDGDNWFFMDEVSYEEKMVPSGVIGDYDDWITEGMKVQLVEHEDKVIDVNLPSTMVLKVEQTDPNVKGNSAQGVTKPAKLECGATIMVPGFIDVGEDVLVDVPNKAYMSRAK